MEKNLQKSRIVGFRKKTTQKKRETYNEFRMIIFKKKLD